MLKRLLIPSSVMLAPFVLTFACGGSDSTSSSATGLDTDHNGLADDLGVYVDVNPHDGKPDTIDINHDGKQDGIAVDTTGKGLTANGLALDMDCDGVFDSVDTNGDGLPDYQTRRAPVTPPASCHPVNPVTGGQAGGGSGGAGGAPVVSGGAGSGVIAHGGGSGSTTSGGAGAPTVTAGAAGSPSTNGQLGKGVYQGSGDTTDRYAEGDVYRGGVGYKFIANGWGTNWQSHHITWNGTSFNVKTLNGTQGSDYSPAGYPTMFCGLYSKKQSDVCGLPITIASAKAIKTGWRWKANGSGGQFNAAWDIWLGDGGNLSSYLMVWLHDPPGQQPAGSASIAGAKVTGLPGSWNVWKGDVKGIPIVNYVQPEGQDLGELEFDVLDVYRDAIKQNPNIRGSQILAVAVGYEVWNGPVTNLETDDFYVDAK